jgi:hypothetical protein
MSVSDNSVDCIDKADTIDLVEMLDAGDTVEIEVSSEVDLRTNARETETYELTVDSAEVTINGAVIKFIDEGSHSTQHARIDTNDRNTDDDFPAFLTYGSSTRKRSQDRKGRVETVRITPVDEKTDSDDDDENDATTDNERINDLISDISDSPIVEGAYYDDGNNGIVVTITSTHVSDEFTRMMLDRGYIVSQLLHSESDVFGDLLNNRKMQLLFKKMSEA